MSEKKDTIREMMKETYGPESCNPNVFPGVSYPSYYKAGGIEAIDVIEAWNLNFCIGNVLKYIARGGRKSTGPSHIQDLEKAKWYLEREIERLEKE